MSKNPSRLASKVANFESAVRSLSESLALPIERKRDLSGVIKDFELAYELAWKSLKIFLAEGGHETESARDVFAQAYRLGYVQHEDEWLSIIKDRNETVHTYDEKMARAMVRRIRESHSQEFVDLLDLLRSKVIWQSC